MLTCGHIQHVRRSAAVREITWEQLPAAGIPTPVLALAVPAPAGRELEEWSQKSASPHPWENLPRLGSCLLPLLLPLDSQLEDGKMDGRWETRGQEIGFLYPHLPGEEPRHPPPQDPASSLASSCSASASGICPAAFFLVCVWVVGGRDSDPTLTGIVNLGCTSKSSGELSPGPCPWTTESEPLMGRVCIPVFFLKLPRWF